MEFLFSIVGHRLTIGLRGEVGEKFRLPNEIRKLLESSDNISEIVFVLRKVDKIDKRGVPVWFNEVKEIMDKGYTVTLIECPKELLEPLIKTDKKASKILRSFLIPYYCDSCQEEFPQLINTSSMTLSFSSYSKPSCPKCRARLTLDITDDEVERISSLLPISDAYSDKRKYPRFDAAVYNLKLDVTKKGESSKFTFDLINFSEVGICMAGKKSFEPGETVNIELSHKNKKVKSEGVIIWRSVDSDGNCFHGVALSSRDIFYLLIKE